MTILCNSEFTRLKCVTEFIAAADALKTEWNCK